MSDSAPAPARELEAAVLACVLLHPSLAPRLAAACVDDEHLIAGTAHRLIAEAMVDLEVAGTPIDVRTVQAQLEMRGQLVDAGGVAALVALDLELPDASRFEHYLDLLRQHAARRRLVLGLTGAQRSLRSGAGTADALAELEALVSTVASRAWRGGLQPASACVLEADSLLSKRSERPGELLGLPTGFLDVDRMTQGLCPGHLIVVAGRPGMGKTSWACDVALHTALQAHRCVAYFSMEMSSTELLFRLAASRAGVDLQRIRSAWMTQREWDAVVAFFRELASSALYLDDSLAATPSAIGAALQRLHAERPIDLVIVDGLWLMESGRRHRTREDEVRAISRGMKVLARQRGVPIVLLHQLSREPERRAGDHRPRLADLRESGAVEQDADLVAFLYREEVYSPDDPQAKGLAELIVAKHRNGPTGSVQLAWRPERTSFASLARQDAF